MLGQGGCGANARPIPAPMIGAPYQDNSDSDNGCADPSPFHDAHGESRRGHDDARGRDWRENGDAEGEEERVEGEVGTPGADTHIRPPAGYPAQNRPHAPQRHASPRVTGVLTPKSVAKVLQWSQFSE